jgi:hypothetical protein
MRLGVCDPNNELEHRSIFISASVVDLPAMIDTLQFIGTVRNKHGFVMHAFEGVIPETKKL